LKLSTNIALKFRFRPGLLHQCFARGNGVMLYSHCASVLGAEYSNEKTRYHWRVCEARFIKFRKWLRPAPSDGFTHRTWPRAPRFQGSTLPLHM